MSSINVKAFPAGYGDSFFITIKDTEGIHNILVDCGFVSTYRDYIKGELESTDSISLIVLTHIDDDHINGALEMFKDSDTINTLEIKNIWFNELYKMTLGKYIEHLSKSDQENRAENKQNGFFDESVGYIRAKNLSNYILGSRHASVWNKDSTLIMCNNDSYQEMYPLNEQIKFVVLSPHENRLEELFEEWCRKLHISKGTLEVNDDTIQLFYKYFSSIKEPRELFDEPCGPLSIDIEGLANKDYSTDNVANDASIAFFIEFKDKRILFLGDSHSADIKNSLKKYVEDNKLEKLKFDLVKVSHHGSKYNIDTELFDYIYADKYLISTNGKRHNHPDIECLCKIIVKQKEFKQILFNYRRQEILNKLDKEELKTKYNYELIMPHSNTEITLDIEV